MNRAATMERAGVPNWAATDYALWASSGRCAQTYHGGLLMASKLNPYINFKDNARQALEFYRSVFGGDLNIMTFGDMNATQDPADKDHVMHGQLETSNGMT